MDIDCLEEKLVSVIGGPDRLSIMNQLPTRLSSLDIWSKRLTTCSKRYFLLYTGPIIEILNHNSSLSFFREEPYWTALLEAHTLLSYSLRVMDDVIDGDVRGKLMMKAVRQAENLQLEAAICLESINKKWNRGAQQLFHKWIQYEESISEGADLIFCELWQRASPLLIIPEIYIQAPIEVLQAYRHYLSLLMLVHDIQDIFDDVKAGRRTIPTEIIKSSGPQIILTPSSIESYFDHFIPLVDQEYLRLKSEVENMGLCYWPFLLYTVKQEFWN